MASSRRAGATPMRAGRLLVPVRAASGASYREGTGIRFSGGGSVVDAWIRGDWVALSWWEFAPVDGGPDAAEAP